MTQSFQPVFSYGISHHIVPNCARFGSTDNTEQSQLVVATTTNKIIIHDSEIILNINEKIQALEVTKLFGTYDVIIVGTVSSILVYDAYKNISVFKRDVADGVNCIQVGNFSTYEKLIFCGGNCAIWGFDIEGKDVFWTVTGDNVLSLCLSDIDNDGISELIVGSESFDIRVFKGDLLLYEMTETDAVINLHDFGNGMFAYALLNGTLGMYKGNTRLWRIKSQNEVAALAQFPDAQTVVCAWINGKIEMRDSETGEVKVTESIGDDIAALFVNSENLVVISKDGNVHGFAGQVEEKIIESQQNLLHELNMKKYKILAELKNYERDEMEVEKTTEKETKFLLDFLIIMLIIYFQIDTKLESCLQVDSQAKPPCIELQLSASGDALIRAVILFAEGIFNGESYVIHPDEDLTSNMAIQLRPEKDLAVDLHIEAFLGDAHRYRILLLLYQVNTKGIFNK
ncbi:unnamed protein product [Thelazia callipaeda]|uniref:Bardet-Biedl syndrome 2 protein homolog n=1 Tax=Thelazia callipaeda TaxID=103827 RepID=A0A0N5CNT2_THECL|nr:unnamed protein product [Thelazia callipaeda]